MNNEYLSQIPKPLIEDIIRGQCVPIIGAGFSLNSNYPKEKKMLLWDDMGKAFSEQMSDYSYTNAIDAISAYSHDYSRAKLIEKLREFLLIDVATPGNTHISFAELPFTTVITTNFDFLLERAYEQVRRPINIIVDENQLSINHEISTLIKMHGDLNHPNHLVATEEDYDSYLIKNPLISTYISNLLISKTPLFIGYSLDDSDFRQIWQVIKSRLGSMRRAAYIITIGVSASEISRFERRGVKVINIKGVKKDYPNVLPLLFKELKEYWTNSVLKNSTITREESINEISLPSEANSRICFFSLPSALLSFYRTYVFPIFEEFGFKPIVSEDIITTGDNMLAKINALIERSLFVVVDVSNSSWIMHEVKIAIDNKKEIICISEKIEKINISNHRIIIRPNEISLNGLEEFLISLENLLDQMRANYIDVLKNEPLRLLEIKEYRAAVVSAISLLESELNQYLNISKNFRYGIASLINEAIKMEIIRKEEFVLLQDAIKIRNKAIHSSYNVEAKEAKDIVKNIIQIVENTKMRK